MLVLIFMESHTTNLKIYSVYHYFFIYGSLNLGFETYLQKYSKQ